MFIISFKNLLSYSGGIMISFVCLILRPPALSEVFDREEEMYCISPLFTNFFTNSDLKNSSYTYTLYTV